LGDNISVGLKAVSWEDLDWINLAQDRYRWQTLVNIVMNLWVPKSTGDLWTSRGTGGFSKKALLHRVS
jgi:hypothetical protein